MKKLLIPLSFCLLAIGSVSAQEKDGFEKKNHPHHKHQDIAKKLNLSTEQQQQMKSIQQDFKVKAKTLKSNDNITLGDFKKQMKSLKEQRKTAIGAMLTSEQKANLKAGREQKMREKATAQFEKLKTTLQLTEAQQVYLKREQDEIQQKMKVIHSNEMLSKESKKEQVMALRNERKVFLKSVLTLQQVQKFESMKRVKK